MKVMRFPLVGSYTNRNIDPGNSSTVGQQFVNCYPEVTVNPVTGKKEAGLYKRPGFTTAGATLTGAVAACSSGGIVAWTGFAAATTPPVVAAFLHSSATSTGVFNLLTHTQVGNFIPATNDCGALTETTVNGVATLVGVFYDASSGEPEIWYTPEGGSWAMITSTCVTSATVSTRPVGFPAHMDGHMFIMMQDGKIRSTDLNTVSSIQAANFATAGSYPDRGVTLARMGQYIMAFGEKSIEPFYNAGNAAGSVLSRVQGGTIHMGASRRHNLSNLGLPLYQSVMTAHGTIYWIATNSEGATIGIYRFNGMQPEKISTPAIDKLLSSLQIAGFVGTKMLHGMRHISLRGPDTNPLIYNYCVDTNYWWTERLASGSMRACLGVGIASNPTNAVTYFTGTMNARANVMGDSLLANTYSDGTSTYTMTVQTDNIDGGTDRKKYYPKLRMTYDRQATTSPITISSSDNDFASYTTLGSIDTVSSNRQSWITRLGSSRRRSWKFEHSADTPCHIYAVEIEYEEGQS